MPSKKSSCRKGEVYNKRIDACKEPCKGSLTRSYKYPYDCIPKKSKSGKKPKCTPKRTKSGKKRVFISKAGNCRVACAKGERRLRKSPFVCYKPKTRSKK